MSPPRVGVIGAGITGLTAGYRLQQRGCEVTVFEASDRAGGKIATDEIDGIRVEEGPDAFLPRDERVVDLCRDLGFADDLVSPAVFGAYIWHRGALRRLPAGSPYGIPRDPRAAWREGLLSAAGAARAALERLHTKPLEGPDISVGSFVAKRFGREVRDHLVDPLLAGVRGGRTNEMSLAAAAKEIDALARTRPSILRALAEQEPTQPGFLAPKGGMQAITDRLAAKLEDLRTGTEVTGVEMAHAGPGSSPVVIALDADRMEFDAAIVTLPTHAAAGVLNGSAPKVARVLTTITSASVIVVTLVYPPGSFIPPPGGSGFLVPGTSRLTISACTWYSTKWPDPATNGCTVLRCVIGRAGDHPGLETSDDELSERVQQDLVLTLGIGAHPSAAKVTRWPRSIPEYRVGHLERVAEIERALARLGPVFLAGAGYRGSGIPDCVAGAESAVERVLVRLQHQSR